MKYCYEDEELDHVAKNMGDIQVRRLPVVNRDKRLVGIVSLGDVAQKRRRQGGRGGERRVQAGRAASQSPRA